jgi:type II restriction enzyme
MIPLEEVQSLVPDLQKLTAIQYAWIKELVVSMALPVNSQRAPTSDIIPDDTALGTFFLHLVTHHALSSEAFKKEKLEYAIERIMAKRGHTVTRPKSRTHPGLDLTVDKERWSFKSEAHSGIKPDYIWVSKWMELGKGQWSDKEDELKGLCARFIHHLDGYDRIFMLRCLTPDDPKNHFYELVEIPKDMMLTAPQGKFTMMMNSTQNPKPGYCRVQDANGELAYELYFDGGSERKLQVKSLRRSLCKYHASWRFTTP